jgi:hypothetical protein
MDRFGSSKLRIVWTLLFLFLSGLVFMAVKGEQGPDGSRVLVMGTALPLGPDTLRSYVVGNLQPALYWAVSLVMLLGAFFPLVQASQAATAGERLKGYFGSMGLGALHGAFLGQVALLPLWSLCMRLLGEALPAELLRADLHGLLLGLQMLMWAVLLARLFRSNAGLALLMTLLLRELGPKLSFILDFGEDMGLSKGAVSTVNVFHKLLPMAQLPSDPFSPLALPLSLGGPLLLGALVAFLPVGSAKAPAPKKAKK